MCKMVKNIIIKFLTLFGDGECYNSEIILSVKSDLYIRNI